jgi:hypothetical protein
MIWLIAAVAGLLESPRFLLSGKPATAVIGQILAANEPFENHMPGTRMSTPAGKGLTVLREGLGGVCVVSTLGVAPSLQGPSVTHTGGLRSLDAL